MNKKKNINFLVITIVTAVILAASITAYAIAPGNQTELNIVQASRLVSSIKSSHFSQYPDFNELYFTSGKGYEYKNDNSDKLIIYLGCFSWGSAVQTKWSDKIIDVLLETPKLNERYTFFVPEKNNREIGALYGLDIKEREWYTIDNLIENYINVISEYLSQNNYESIIIYGASEGAFILPILYSRLNNINIKALISDSGGGGLNYIEQQNILLTKLLRNERAFSSLPITKEQRSNLQFFYETWLDTFQTRQLSGSADFFLNSPMTYKYFSNITRLNLIDYYERINIPVMFIHGNLDTEVPVETTQYIQANFKSKPFDFFYYADMTHLQIKQQVYVPENDIAEWILRIDG